MAVFYYGDPLTSFAAAWLVYQQAAAVPAALIFLAGKVIFVSHGAAS
jgi:hypothetical protein